MSTKRLLPFILVLNYALLGVTGVLLYNKKFHVEQPNQEIINEILIDQQPEPPAPEQNPDITNVIPQGSLKFDAVGQWLDQWHAEAPEITEVGFVGKDGPYDIKYIRIGKKTGPKVLIHACVHGNEKLCAMTAMGCVGRLLKDYMDDDEVTEVLRTRDFYFVPVVCPDGYINNSRHTRGLDPNRNWNAQNLAEITSIASVQAMKDWFEKEQFKAVMSCHNYGKVYFLPWGYVHKQTEHHQAYQKLLAKMSSQSGYNYEQLYRQSAPPYFGYEIDWYYKHGAISIVNEIGRNFEATNAEVALEVDKNYSAFITFIKDAPTIRSTQVVFKDDNQ